MDGYAAHPDGGGPFPLVAMFMDVWGLREELFAIARRVAARGYYCVVPNLFYREGKIRYALRNAAGQMVSFEALPVAKQQEMHGHSAKVDRPRTRVDIAAILEFCRNEPVDSRARRVVRILSRRPRRVLCRAGISRTVFSQRQPARHLAGHR